MEVLFLRYKSRKKNMPKRFESLKLGHIINCAKAMDLWFKDRTLQDTFIRNYNTEFESYNPYKSYEQALKLVERYYLTVSRYRDDWMVTPSLLGHHFREEDIVVIHKRICSAITECASKMYERLEENRKEIEKAKGKFK